VTSLHSLQGQQQCLALKNILDVNLSFLSNRKTIIKVSLANPIEYSSNPAGKLLSNHTLQVVRTSFKTKQTQLMGSAFSVDLKPRGASIETGKLTVHRN